jgi:hypothetical protein
MLGAQRALVGAIGPHLLGACVGVTGETVSLTWYVTPEITEDERDDLQAAGGEVIGDFSAAFDLVEQFVEVSDVEQPLPTVGEWVFLRRELRTA